MIIISISFFPVVFNATTIPVFGWCPLGFVQKLTARQIFKVPYLDKKVSKRKNEGVTTVLVYCSKRNCPLRIGWTVSSPLCGRRYPRPQFCGREIGGSQYIIYEHTLETRRWSVCLKRRRQCPSENSYHIPYSTATFAAKTFWKSISAASAWKAGAFPYACPACNSLSAAALLTRTPIYKEHNVSFNTVWTINDLSSPDSFMAGNSCKATKTPKHQLMHR